MAQLATVVIGAVAAFGAFAAWIVRHMDRRFDEFKADMQRQFDEFKADMQRQFGEFKADMQRQAGEDKTEMQKLFGEFKADVQRQIGEGKTDLQRQIGEGKTDLQRQIDEVRTDMQRGFDRMREDHLLLEKKLDAQGEQIADLRQDVGRLQGIVERNYQPGRFTVPPVREAGASEGVREARTGYDAGPDSEDPERKDDS